MENSMEHKQKAVALTLVECEKSAKQFIRDLHSNDLLYHPDDGAVSCLHDNGLVSLAQAQQIEEQMNKCFYHLDDVYEVCLDVMGVGD